MELNKYVARVADLNMKTILNASEDLTFFDTSVYKLKKSLRLPFCGKIKKNVFEDRQLLPVTDSVFADFLITNV